MNNDNKSSQDVGLSAPIKKIIKLKKTPKVIESLRDEISTFNQRHNDLNQAYSQLLGFIITFTALLFAISGIFWNQDTFTSLVIYDLISLLIIFIITILVLISLVIYILEGIIRPWGKKPTSFRIINLIENAHKDMKIEYILLDSYRNESEFIRSKYEYRQTRIKRAFYLFGGYILLLLSMTGNVIFIFSMNI